MSLTFLTPLGALLALGALVPMATLAAVSKRARRIRQGLGLPEPPASRRLVPILALLAAAGLLALAAAQPIFARTTTRLVRSDAEAFVVVDVSRSMLAQRDPGSRSRLERAKAAAAELRASLPRVRFGIASLTDRVLPHLLPSSDEDVFLATLERSIGIEQPPPRSSFLTNATSFDSLAAVATRRFFSPAANHRLLVVLTDGESVPVAVGRIARAFRGPPRIGTVFVHFWNADEQVFTHGVPEPQYRADTSARSTLDDLAAAIGGSVYSESELGDAARKSRELLRHGPTLAQGERRARLALAPYLAAAAFVPLALLLLLRDR